MKNTLYLICCVIASAIVSNPLHAEVLTSGCTNPSACNYNPSATTDDGSCLLTGGSCDDGNPNTGPGTVNSHTIGSVTWGAYYGHNTVASGQIMGQTFTATATGPVTTARIVGTYVTWATGTMSCAIYDEPGGAILATATNEITFASGVSTHIFNFSGFSTVSGQSYFLGFTPIYSGHVLYQYAGTAYAGGEAYHNGSASGIDLPFLVSYSCTCIEGPTAVTGCTDSNACNYNASASNDDGSCLYNDFCGVCGGDGIGGCADADACNFNAAADCDNGSCFYTCNDTPIGAVELNLFNLGVCNALAGQDMNAASLNHGGLVAASGNDLWYLVEPATSGIRIQVETSAFDAIVELVDSDMNTVASTNANSGNGDEYLNFGGLTPGDTYYIRVAAANPVDGQSLFSVCAQQISEAFVSTTQTTLSVCQNLKSQFVSGANNYIFRCAPQGGGEDIVFETNAAFTIAPIANIGLDWEQSYEVSVDVQLTLSTGDGSTENIIVPGSLSKTYTISTHPLAELRPADRVQNAGGLLPGAFVFAAPFVCNTTGWTWEFTNSEGAQLPFTFYKGSPGRELRLSTVTGLEPGVVYNVRVKPEFASGFASNYGATGQLMIIGSLSLEGEIMEPIDLDTVDERWAAERLVGVKLFPNPNRGDFINLVAGGIDSSVRQVIFELSNMQGQRVQREIFSMGDRNELNTRIVFRNLRPGMYIATIIAGERTHTERIIIQR